MLKVLKVLQDMNFPKTILLFKEVKVNVGYQVLLGRRDILEILVKKVPGYELDI